MNTSAKLFSFILSLFFLSTLVKTSIRYGVRFLSALWKCVCAMPYSCNPMYCSPPGSSVHGISQVKILERAAISFRRRSSWPRDQTCIFCIAAAAKLLQSCPTLCNPIDGSPPGSPVPGILQARTLEWVAISFSNASKWKVKVKSLSHVWLLATPWTAAYQASPSMGFSRQEYWRGVPLPSPSALQADYHRATREAPTLWTKHFKTSRNMVPFVPSTSCVVKLKYL